MIRSMRLWCPLLALALAACGARPAPTMIEQRAVVEQAPTPDRARLGWWRYLTDDPAGAAEAWAAAGEAPLAALGLARLAQDRLDHAAAFRAAVRALDAPTPTHAAIAHRWVARAAVHLPDGAARLKAARAAAAGARVRVTGARSTLRVSFLPYLDLAHLATTPPTLHGARVHALGKQWALSKGLSKPDADGLVLTAWPLPDGPAHLELRVDGPTMAWRGGARVFASETGRYPAGRARFDAPGEGPLLVVWAARQPPALWRTVWPAPRTSARPGPVVPERAATPDWVDRWLDVELALLDGAPEVAAARLESAPDTPAFALLRARLARQAPGRPDHTRRDAARAHWTAAVPVAPALAQLKLGALAWRAGDPEAALTHLDAARSLAPGAYEVHRARARALAGADQPAAARRALAEATRLAPDACALLDDRASLGGGTDGRTATALAEAYLACGRVKDAAERLLEQHRPEAALAALTKAADSAAVQRLRARALLGLGRLAEARAAFSATGQTDDALVAADLKVAERPDDLSPLAALVAEAPTASAALTLIAARPSHSPFAPLLVETEAAIAAYEATVPQPGPAVRVLDHSALLYFADGKSLRWVHEVLAIRSREAAETYGEIGLPTDTRTVALYTRKADGRRLFGEEVPEKDSITLPELSSGDYVVAVYLEPADNGYLYDRGYLSRRVFFQGVDLPIFHQRFDVFSPDATPPEVQRLAGAPEPTPITLGARKGWRFEARRVRMIPREPDTPHAARWLPSVRVGHGVKLADDLAYLRDRVLAHRRQTQRFEAWARQAAGRGDVGTQVAQLTRAVREQIDDTLGLIDEDVARAIETGVGNRALVLSAALEVIGVPHQLFVARTRVHAPAGPFLQAADFPYPLLRWAGGVIDPGPHRAALGFVPFTVLGGDGLQLWPPDGPDTPAPVAPMRTVVDRRRVRISAHWSEDGTLRGTVEDRLEGQEAIVIGHAMGRITAEQRLALTERLLVSALGAAKVTDLDDVTAQDPDGPLTLRYRFEAQVGDVAPIALFPVAPGRSHAVLPERRLPLEIVLPTDQRVVLSLTSDRDFALAAKPMQAAHGPHHFSLEIEHDDDRLIAVSTVGVAGGVIAPETYGDFVQWARRVDDAERLRLSIVP